MTVEQLIRRIRSWIGEPLEGSNWENDLDYILLINVIVQDIVKDTKCMPSEVDYDTVATREIDLLATDNILSIMSIMDKSNGRFLVKRDKQWFYENKGLNWLTNTGEPENYYEKGQQIGFNPFETGRSYTFSINKKPTDVSELTDIPFDSRVYLFPYHYIIIPGVALFFYRERKPTEVINYQLAQKEYINGKNALKNAMIGGLYGAEDITFGLSPRVLRENY